MTVAFATQWAGVFDWIAEKYPGFWEDLEDEVKDLQECQVFTGFAVMLMVLLRARKIAVQAGLVRWDTSTQVMSYLRDATVQATPIRREVSVQFPIQKEVGMQTEAARRNLRSAELQRWVCWIFTSPWEMDALIEQLKTERQ